MRKLTPVLQTLLELISDAGGSWCPSNDLSPEAKGALHDLVKAKRLTVEATDGGNRYHLTAQGREDANG